MTMKSYRDSVAFLPAYLIEEVSAFFGVLLLFENKTDPVLISLG